MRPLAPLSRLLQPSFTAGGHSAPGRACEGGAALSAKRASGLRGAVVPFLPRGRLSSAVWVTVLIESPGLLLEYGAGSLE